MMLVLSQLIYFTTKQAQYTKTFSQAPLSNYKGIYIEVPHRFDIKWEGEYVVRLDDALYGMVESLRRWFDILYMGQQEWAMYPSDYDMYLFTIEHVIYVVYVHCFLLFSKQYKFIRALNKKMREQKIELKYEEQGITVFLGQDIDNTGTSNNKTIKFTIGCQIDFIMSLTVMNDFTPKDTPSIQTPLVQDIDCAPYK